MRYAYGVAWPCCSGEPLSRSPPARPARRSRRTRRQRSRRAPARRCPSPTSPRGFSRRWSTSRPSSASPVRSPGRPVRGILPPLRRADAAAGRSARASRARRAGPQPRDPRSRLARLGLHHFARRLCRHQQPPDPGRSGTGTVDSVTVILSDRKEYPARIVGRDPASDLALLKIEGSQPAVRQLRRFDPRPRRRLGDRDRQSLRPWRHRHRRHHLGAAPRHHRRRRLRPLHPDRRQHQHGQFAAARCSTWPATSSASIRR